MDCNNDYLMHYGVKGMKWGVIRFQNKTGNKRYTNRQITREKDKFFNDTYKELHEQYNKHNSATAADRAYIQARKLNTKHLVDTYGKERMDKYYESEHKKFVAAGTLLVGSLATMSVIALVGNMKS